mmetsp:Transcript_26792/g.41565  ORF Transcript_26792/g.41565 Transcript_26792/m.41565 type:complete len:157 (+) Transcript_26792:259-729(+)
MNQSQSSANHHHPLLVNQSSMNHDSATIVRADSSLSHCSKACSLLKRHPNVFFILWWDIELMPNAPRPQDKIHPSYLCLFVKSWPIKAAEVGNNSNVILVEDVLYSQRENTTAFTLRQTRIHAMNDKKNNHRSMHDVRLSNRKRVMAPLPPNRCSS